MIKHKKMATYQVQTNVFVKTFNLDHVMLIRGCIEESEEGFAKVTTSCDDPY